MVTFPSRSELFNHRSEMLIISKSMSDRKALGTPSIIRPCLLVPV